MLERLHHEVRVLARQPGASAADVASLQARYPELPLAFADLMREVTELELAYRVRYLRLLQRPKHGLDGASPLMLVLGRHERS